MLDQEKENMERTAIIEACARAAHEVNRAYCAALGDITQVSWDAAPDWQKSSARNGVAGVLFDGNGPEDSHRSWLAEKEASGWKYGPVKNPDTKEHPCMVPYDELPAEQRTKDELFVNAVIQMALAFEVAPESFAEVIVTYGEDGHGGPGWYVYYAEYPEEGSEFWGAERPTFKALAIVEMRETTP
jgi:hypothetical protein